MLIIINFSSNRKFGGSTFDNYIYSILNTEIVCFYKICVRNNMCTHELIYRAICIELLKEMVGTH